jgi:hypothetical protein
MASLDEASRVLNHGEGSADLTPSRESHYVSDELAKE